MTKRLTVVFAAVTFAVGCGGEAPRTGAEFQSSAELVAAMNGVAADQVAVEGGRACGAERVDRHGAVTPAGATRR